MKMLKSLKNFKNKGNKRGVMKDQKFKPMRYYEMKLKLENCWISKMAHIFEGVEGIILSVVSLKNILKILLLLRFNSNISFSEESILDFLENCNNIYAYSYTKIKSNEYLLAIDCKCRHYAANYFGEKSMDQFIIYPLWHKDVTRVFRVLSPSCFDIEDLRNELINHSCKPSILKVTRYKNLPSLIEEGIYTDISELFFVTEKEKEYIQYALGEGYYDSPRKKTLLDIAKKYRIPRSTYQLNLRKAESKIIKNFLKHISRKF